MTFHFLRSVYVLARNRMRKEFQDKKKKVIIEKLTVARCLYAYL